MLSPVLKLSFFFLGTRYDQLLVLREIIGGTLDIYVIYVSFHMNDRAKAIENFFHLYDTAISEVKYAAVEYRFIAIILCMSCKNF